ncbi:Tim44 domain-containing protein [Bacterioplanoides pacificum]|uniref:Tim44 domain-containing protein n=1 Tax=Bacterioplanoides pacificum TaxID=1171596 RepID=A0ABV7VQ64_9GAMM
MKSFLTLLTSLCLIFAVAGEAHAKRFGGGGFGKSYKTTPFKKSEPQKQQQQQPASGKKNAGKGMMGGLLGGLLAGGLFAYLLGNGAFEGIQFMDILLLAVLAFVALKVFRSMAGAQRQPVAQGAAGYAQTLQNRDNFAQESHNAADQQTPFNLPQGFDADAFIEGALQHYRTVQQAWNDGQLDIIEEYVSAPLFAGLKQQREKLMVPPQTEILSLSAEIVRADQQGNMAEISILFRGLCKDELEKSEDGIFDTWHLERDTSIAQSSWIIVGIEAE